MRSTKNNVGKALNAVMEDKGCKDLRKRFRALASGVKLLKERSVLQPQTSESPSTEDMSKKRCRVDSVTEGEETPPRKMRTELDAACNEGTAKRTREGGGELQLSGWELTLANLSTMIEERRSHAAKVAELDGKIMAAIHKAGVIVLVRQPDDAFVPGS
ncbi:hypothetical protein BDM02DRAFT_3133520 [Thelephora ganbajun]|uniref:Uncharacterized protein n=1 Tax=Thelephora ganbajun TaxID=370292 RepID=A0ACB6YWM0_THEGA|nr:hypothetical protein BDM02DRAFT_3133520 [Thelephora ganbajun]